MVEDLKPDDTKASLRPGRVAVIALSATAIAVFACFALDFYKVNPSQLELKNLPPLLPAPPASAQNQMIADIRKNPLTFELGDQIPRGTDAKGLAPLLSVMGTPEKRDGASTYQITLFQGQDHNMETRLIIKVAGDPPRVIHRNVESVPSEQ